MPGLGAGRRGGEGRAAVAGTGPLVGQGGVGHPPAVVEPAQDLVVADPGLVEEDLVEHGPPRHLPQRPDLDARLIHVEDEVGDAPALGRIGVGTGDQHGQVGGLTGRGPHLLPADHPLVTVPLGPGLEAGQIGTGLGLGEQLAPAGGPVENRPQMTFDLGRRPVIDQGRRGEQQPELRRRPHGCRMPGNQRLDEGIENLFVLRLRDGLALAEYHHRAVVHRAVKSGPGHNDAVRAHDRDGGQPTGAQMLEKSGLPVAVQIEVVTPAHVQGRDDPWFPILHVGHMGYLIRIQHRPDGFQIISPTIPDSPDPGPVRARLSGHEAATSPVTLQPTPVPPSPQ